MILTDWLDEIPDDWECVPAWSLFSERIEKAEPGDVHLTPSQAHGVLPQTEYMEITGSRVVLNLTGADNMKAVHEGDFICHLRSFQGGLEQSLLRGKVSQAYTVLCPSVQVYGGYFRHLVKSRIFIEQLNNLTDQLRDGQTINYARFARMGLPLPPFESQRAISQYLDREINEIDAMSAKLDELAETLVQRRKQAIQSSVCSLHSISIGLMLEVKLGKMLQMKPKSPADRLQPYLRAAHIQPGGRLNLAADTKEMYFSEPEAEALSLRAGDAVIVEGGAGFGRAAYLVEDMPGWGFQNSIIRLRGASADSRYVVYALQAALDSGEIAVACNVATFAHFTAEKVEGFRVPYHGTDEHQRIADHLDEVTGRIDAMLAKIDELKALLVGRRAALITDVVTGRKKIPS
ncbi:type I restriction modification protein subunit S [Xylanimonas cellulosilytica]|jgi:hypothetical protein|uniref:type I restriction modification protein subunit S n=1 Tax=Xylanimonas cellulosilytica TaxID=186189 RepID=UPI000660B181|nr:type I restriction modification protein subunit S [Xylanimonas cellulosilytica]